MAGLAIQDPTESIQYQHLLYDSELAHHPAQRVPRK